MSLRPERRQNGEDQSLKRLKAKRQELSACIKKFKTEPLNNTATIGTSAHEVNEEIQRQWVKIREGIEFNVSVADQNNLDRMRLDNWEEELQERKKVLDKHRKDE